MFQRWRFQRREADEVLRAGQLEEALQRVRQDALDQYLPGRRLTERLGAAFAERARQQAQAGRLKEAWRDAARMKQALGDCPPVAALHEQLQTVCLAEVERQLQAGETAAALQLLDGLERHVPAGAEARSLRRWGQQMQSAAHLERSGKFAEAERVLEECLAQRPHSAVLRRRRDEVRQKHDQSRLLTEMLHRALADADWPEALSAADRLLEMAPDHRLALEARRKAWPRVGGDDGHAVRLQTTRYEAPGSHPAARSPGQRFLLWVDGVGGYLVCMQDEVWLGQSAADGQVEIPLQADLSRRHARILRSGEGYALEPWHAARVNGRPCRAATLLGDGDEIELGRGVRFRFRRPHALSATARLEPLSGHRCVPSVDAILLMAESCVLGPQWRNHVVCRDWSQDLVLFRREDGLHCRTAGTVAIDGQWCDGHGRLIGGARVVGSDFSLSLEELDRCATQPLL